MHLTRPSLTLFAVLLWTTIRGLLAFESDQFLEDALMVMVVGFKDRSFAPTTKETPTLLNIMLENEFKENESQKKRLDAISSKSSPVKKKSRKGVSKSIIFDIIQYDHFKATIHDSHQDNNQHFCRQNKDYAR